MKSETDLLETARRFSFGGRMDKSGSGPIFVRGSGSEVEDINGKRYLDFNSGQMCAWLGHNHPAIVEAVAEACDTLIHAHSSYYNDKEIELAERLGRILPDPLQKSMFLQSGADANEAAINIARKYTGGFEIVSPHTSFHGMSDTTRSLTFAGWHRGYGPPQPGMMAMLAPYCYRCPINLEPETCDLACLDASFELIDAQTTSRPAAVLTEPIFSAGGVIEPPIGWLPELKRRCEERGMLLILDEEQTGLGKTGDTFAFEHEGVVPDIITLAKHFGGGVCISSVTTSAEVEQQVIADEFIVTHSHSNDPLACAAGTATLDVLEEEDLAVQGSPTGQPPEVETQRPGRKVRDHRRHPRPRSVAGNRTRPGQADPGTGHNRRQGDHRAMPANRTNLQRPSRRLRPPLRPTGQHDRRADRSGGGHP